MLQLIFSVYDKKAQSYGRPFTMQNQAVALRSFATACRDANSELSMHPGDYNLQQLGTFDDESGALVANHPETIAEAVKYQYPEGETK